MTRQWYVFYAFVGSNNIKRGRSEGLLRTFRQMYRECPPDCRYAVAQEEGGEYVVFDLDQATLTPAGIEGKWKKSFKTLDAAIMAVRLNYNSEGMFLLQNVTKNK